MQVRGGDFPLDSDRLAALILLGGVERSDRVQQFFDRAEAAQQEADDIEEERGQADSMFQNDELDDLI